MTDDYSKGAAYIDGGYVPIDEARIPVLDWGFTHSDVTYDVVHVWKAGFSGWTTTWIGSWVPAKPSSSIRDCPGRK